MWFRSACIALLAVAALASAGTAEFTSPSMDQWGGGAEQVLPREHVVSDQLVAGRHPNAVWVAPTSIVLVSGAPVALQNFPAGTTSTVASGEEMILRAPYTRQVEIARTTEAPAAQVYYYPPAVSYRPAPVNPYPIYTQPSASVSVAPAATTYRSSAYEVLRIQAAPASVGEAADVQILDMPVSRPDPRTAMLTPGAVQVIRESTYVTYPATTFTIVR